MEEKTLVEGIKTNVKVFGKKAVIAGLGVLALAAMALVYAKTRRTQDSEPEQTILTDHDQVA